MVFRVFWWLFTTTLGLFIGYLNLHFRLTAAFLDFDSTNCDLPWQLITRTSDFSFVTMDSLRCVYCGIATTRLRRHSIDSDAILSYIRERIAPRLITEADHVCHTCWLFVRELLTVPGSSQASSSTAGHRHVCVTCGRSLLRTRFHSLANNPERNTHIIDVISHWIHPQQITATSSVCHPCWQRAGRARVPINDEPNVLEPPILEVAPVEIVITLPDYRRARETQNHCFVVGCPNQERLTMPLVLRQLLLRQYKFYVGVNNRICAAHIIENNWTFLNNGGQGNHSFSATHIQDMMTVLNTVPDKLDFNHVDEMPDCLVHYWLGRTKEQWYSIINEVPSLAEIHRGKIGLAAYLIKLRTGDSYDRVATLLSLSKKTVIKIISQARECLVQEYVPLHIGLHHISREQVAQRKLLIPNGLFGNDNNAIAIMDGTYIYVEKSSNYLYQKKTYSLHKYRNLVKTFLIVSPDGYIIEVLGPYPATTSDADITKIIFNDNQPLRRYFEEGDVFILDRGFRDALPLLNDSGYRPCVPASVQQGETQLSTFDANQSRAVTICRWVVEVVNGRFKRDFKIFRQEYYNAASNKLMKDFSVAAALINAFHPLITDRDDAGEILEIINRNMYIDNFLAPIVITNNLNRRRNDFVMINVDNNNVNDFPQLTYSELILVCLGTYQLKQARSYYGEHVRANGRYTIEVCREVDSSLLGELSNPNKWILRGKIQSRHVSRKTYFVYIMVDSSLNGRNAIVATYCNCIVGKRTVGCCSHIMSIVWYLGWARFQENLVPPAPQLDNVFVIRNE